MTDPVVVPAAVPSASPAPVAVAPSPVPAPAPEVVVAEVAPTATPEPVASPAPEVAPDTVLGVEPPKVVEPVKADEAVKESAEAPKEGEGENKEEVSQSDEPAPLPSYEPWAFPEGVVRDEAKVAEVNQMLGEFEVLTKADHASVQAFGQKMIDRHVAAVQEVVDGLHKAYQDVWKQQTQSWLEAFKSDPEIGGNRQDTTVSAAREAIRRHGGNEEQQAEFRNLMQTTGLGNHPAMIRMLANINIAKQEGKPVPAAKPVPAPKSKFQKMYGGKK